MPILRILHLADIHIGVENYGRINPATGLSTRLEDFLKSLNEAIDWALANDVHLVIIAGDIFKNRDPSPTVQRGFAGCIRKLSAAGMPTFIIVGNHDLPNTWQRATSVEIYSTLEIPGVTVAQKPGTRVIQTKAGPVQIVALPWISRSTFLSSNELRNLPPNELAREMLTRVEEFIDKSAEKLDPSMPAVLVAHASVQGAKLSTEREMSLGHDLVIPKPVIANPRFDYVAMGHIHKYQEMRGTPPVVYPGSLERIDFGEENDPKGFVVVEIDEPGADGRREVRTAFHEVNARRFLTIEVNADCENPTDEVLRRIEERGDEARDAVVRLIVNTSQERERELRVDEIRRRLALMGASYSTPVIRVTRRHRTLLGDQGVGQMTPEQALQLYLQNKGTKPDRVQVLVEYYRQLSGTTAESERPVTSE